MELFGRRVRYQRLFQAADGGLVATAHTLSDRAETTFINLLRGTGLKGLCSIPASTGEGDPAADFLHQRANRIVLPGK